MMAQKQRILFVCLGDICRSPVGEAVLRKKLADQGYSEFFEIDTAGTIDDHLGELPDPRMREAAARRGYSLTRRARRITRQDLERFDLIIAMDRDNLAQIEELDPYGRYREKIHLLCDFLPDAEETDIPDPYHGPRHRFHAVVGRIEQACGPLAEHLVKGLQEEAEVTV